MRDEQRRLRRLEVGIVGERLLDESVERLRVEQGPPVGGNVGAADKALRLAAGDARRCGGRLRRLRGVWSTPEAAAGALKFGPTTHALVTSKRPRQQWTFDGKACSSTFRLDSRDSCLRRAHAYSWV